MKKTTTSIPADKLALYDQLVASLPGVERKGAGMPYTSVNGNMFSFLTPDGTLALRLPLVDREALIKKFKTQLCEQHGRVLQGYVVAPDALLKKTRELTKYFGLSYHYASSLQPKGVKKAAKKRST
jgi:hypothetical protein